MPAPTATLDPVPSELMLDTLDNGKLYLHSAHRTAIDLLLKQAGKADEEGEIAECRRCCTAILKFEITYPPKHAFFPSSPSDSPLPPGEGPGVRDSDDDEGDEEDDAPVTTAAPASPPLSLPAGEGRGEGVTTTPSQSTTPSVESPAPSAQLIPTPVDASPSPSHRGGITVSPSQPQPTPQDPAPPAPEVPYNPVGELWPPGVDPVTWRDKRPRREPSKPYKPYKPYIHRNYLYILLMALSLVFNSSPSFALAWSTHQWVPRHAAVRGAVPGETTTHVQFTTHAPDTQSLSTHIPDSNTATIPTRHAAQNSVVPGHPILFHSASHLSSVSLCVLCGQPPWSLPAHLRPFAARLDSGPLFHRAILRQDSEKEAAECRRPSPNLL